MRKGMSQALHGRYELKERLSRGGMGEVFTAETLGAEGFRKPVVVKRIIPDERDNPSHRRAFIREAKVLARLAHPNIVQVIELVESGNELFIVMELVNGMDLQRLTQAIRDGGHELSDGMLALIAFDVLEALEMAHTTSGDEVQGVVHSDVSPQNILVSTAGQAKLCDFGIARVGLHEGASMAGRGKLRFVAPEQLTRKPLDARTDVYGLAAVLYDCALGSDRLSGRGPKEVAERIIRGDMPSFGSLAPDRDRRLSAAIDRALRPNPDERFQSAAAFRAAIEPVLEDVGPITVRAQLRDAVRAFVPGGTGVLHERDAKTPQRASRRTAIAVLVALMIATAGGIVWMRTSDRPKAKAMQMVVVPTELPPEPQPQPEPVPPDPVAPEPVTLQPVTTPHRHRPLKQIATSETVPEGFITLNAVPWAYVTIDGRRLDGSTPFLDVPLTPGAHTVLLQSNDGRTQTLEIAVRSGEHITRVVRF